MVGRTTLMIAHRLSTVRHADLILVMNHGEIVERGTHGQLLEQDGLYQQLWVAQTGAQAQPAANQTPVADAPSSDEEVVDAGGTAGCQSPATSSHVAEQQDEPPAVAPEVQLMQERTERALAELGEQVRQLSVEERERQKTLEAGLRALAEQSERLVRQLTATQGRPAAGDAGRRSDIVVISTPVGHRANGASHAESPGEQD
jgi:ABC-type multidrug transport system ATPase subunit